MMIKELSTMALVAVVTTNISNHFGTVMGAAQDIQAVYTQAGQIVTQPHKPFDFVNSVSAQTERLEKIGQKVVRMDPSEYLGPFGTKTSDLYN